MLKYASHFVFGDEVRVVSGVIEKGSWTQGEIVGEFESDIARYLEVDPRNVVCLSSGSTALSVSGEVLKARLGDRLDRFVVLVPTVTFCATLNSVSDMYHLELVDCDPITGNVTVETVQSALRRCRESGLTPIALWVTHMAGVPVDVAAIRELLPSQCELWEDAAHAFGATYVDNGSLVGTHPSVTASVFSFHPSKTISSAEGGCLVTRDRNLAEMARAMRDNGLVRTNHSKFDPYEKIFYGGSNYRMSEIHAALGKYQLSRVGEILQWRQNLAQRYVDKLLPLKSVQLTSRELLRYSSNHLFIAHFPSCDLRSVVDEHLIRAEINCSFHYKPLHTMQLFASTFHPVNFRGAEEYRLSALSLPIHLNMNISDVDQICDVIARVVK